MFNIELFLIGTVVGAMNAIAGGGMLIGFPVLVALGVPPLMANATGNIVTGPGQLASAVGYWRYIRQVPRRFIWLLLPVIAGAACGAIALRTTSAHDFTRLVPGLVLFGVGLFAFQPLLHFHVHRSMKKKRLPLGPLIFIGLALLPLSFYGGYFGAGFGFIMLAFLGFTNLPDAHMINGMKNVAATFVSFTSIICLYSTHLINWHVGVVTALGSIIGGYAGAHAAQRISSHWLRVFIIVVGLIAVVYLATKHY